ncbi:MAG TPA: NADH-quinone oxidoreductase subunit N [Phycisphaerales bacterium]|nr:NADH-quinone oxidoreductase subunit N [Phycisphaerales bacterium]
MNEQLHLILDKLYLILPEIWLFAGVCVVAVMGLSPMRRVREAVPMVVVGFLLASMWVIGRVYSSHEHLDAANLLMPKLGQFVKLIVVIIGILMVMLSTGLIDRRFESSVKSGRISFEPLRANQGEYFAFMLLSLMGVMLLCNSNDLIWMFLALELTSLPTYIMVAMSRPTRRAQEAAVKYFFLGAMASAIFLYGFALLYGATGTLVLTEMRAVFEHQAASGGISTFGIIGMVLAILGIAFKIAAAPMHFYAADVYEGAASPVTAFLAFVPKTAGMVALILLLSTMGWLSGQELPAEIKTTLWMLSVLTMTLGNVGALWQKSIKRMLAYSSIAHSGYMLIGIIAGPGLGVNAVLFYLLAYGVMNTAAFAVLSGLERAGEEVESLEDLAGLRARHPGMAMVLALASGSLLGVPPLLGFWGKLYLFIAGVSAHHIPLVVIAGLNSAVSAWYYLRIVGLPILAKPSAQSETITNGPSVWPRVAGVVTAVGVVALPLFCQTLFKASEGVTHVNGTAIRSAAADTP